LAFMYQRFDLIGVAFIAWALALERRQREVPSGIAFALAILTKLWPTVLLPILWIHRRTRAIVAGAVVALLGGVAWYAVGGPKGPIEVLTFRGAVGWSVESTVGNLVWIASRGQTGPDAGTTRIGIAPTWAKALLLIGLVVTLIVIWRRAAADNRDLAGGSSLAAVIALMVFSPLFSIQYATWVLPWTSIAFEGDEEERRVAAIAMGLLCICGLLGVAYLNDMPLTPLVEKWLLFVRNAVAVWLLVTWLYETRRPVAVEVRV
jgi:hypothetical protein